MILYIYIDSDIHIPLSLQNSYISQVCFEPLCLSQGKTSDLLLAGQLSVSVELAGADSGPNDVYI